MIPQIGLLTEPSLANVTLKRPTTVVNVHVRFQISRRWKRLVTHGAFVRFFLEK